MRDQSLIDQFEQASTEATSSIVQQSKDLADAIGQRPYGQQQVPQRMQARQYQLVRHDPNAWAGIIQTHGAKAAYEYAKRGERLSQRFPDEEAYGLQAGPPAPPPIPGG